MVVVDRTITKLNAVLFDVWIYFYICIDFAIFSTMAAKKSILFKISVVQADIVRLTARLINVIPLTTRTGVDLSSLSITVELFCIGCYATPFGIRSWYVIETCMNRDVPKEFAQLIRKCKYRLREFSYISIKVRRSL